MKIEVKGAKEFHGHDGNGFEASVYVNGTRTAIVSDDGWGGPLMIHPLNEEKLAMIEKGIEGMTWNTNEFDDLPSKEYDMDLDIFLGEIIEEALMKKDAKGKVITKSASGLVQVWSGKFKALDVGAWKELLRLQIDGDFEVVNNTLGVRVI